MKIDVKIGDDFIAISDEKGEIVYWDGSEWMDEPDLVLVIAKAIQIGLTEGPEMLRAMLKKPGSVGRCPTDGSELTPIGSIEIADEGSTWNAQAKRFRCEHGHMIFAADSMKIDEAEEAKSGKEGQEK